MVELERYRLRIQDALGKQYSPGIYFTDKISEEPWFEMVVREINQLSLECARELEMETGKYPKHGSPGTQPLEEAPPTRILALSLVINYWLGWVNNEKNMDASEPQPFKAWERIHEAYMAGRALSNVSKYPKPE